MFFRTLTISSSVLIVFSDTALKASVALLAVLVSWMARYHETPTSEQNLKAAKPAPILAAFITEVLVSATVVFNSSIAVFKRLEAPSNFSKVMSEALLIADMVRFAA